jgi:four helix bundle protein
MTTNIKNFTDLETWRSAHRLVLLIYKITNTFPNHEVFGLANQMNRAAVSVTSNIAEGFGRSSFKEKGRYYLMARGSLYEIENQSYIIHDLKYITTELFNELFQQTCLTQRLLNALINKTKLLGVSKVV